MLCDTCKRGGLTAPAVVELVTWLAVLRLLRRLSCWADPASGTHP